MSMDEQEDHDGRHSRASASRRTRSQCRRKWDSLLSDYKKIKLWESSESQVESYWSIDYERRREFGFPEDFDFEVFKAIDDHLKVGDGSDTDPDVDPEAVADGVAKPG
ncbi:Trihelix transcription factor ASR3 [Camellia lanceoleosa]|uniref:Trihelix transcription factor ASR3 n=1 Tax=Camellia lanceoleosa TaxID=1840588 RepID=A0ACC0I8B5_9ERIC|nr:Trihelix transcription factor ASR3 [Camellia lanceoleosa]